MDLFTLGCTIYFIMMGHAAFPDIVDGEEGWRDKVVDRFAKQQFPQNFYACYSITSRCWMQQYASAKDIVQAIESIEQSFTIEGHENDGKG